MAEHEPSTGASDEWYTPPEIFAALKLTFDLDPCSPGTSHWVPASRVFTKKQNGLGLQWTGLVFMNPPFGERHGHVPWLEQFFAHGHGVAICRAYTSSDWWHEIVVPSAQTILFPRGKTKFIPSEATRKAIEQTTGRPFQNAPGHGIALLGMGHVANHALQQSGLGWFIRNLPS